MKPVKPVDSHGHRHKHEKTDVDFHQILTSAVALSLFILACAAASLLFFSGYVYRTGKLNAGRAGTVMSPVRPAEPRLQPDPTHDLVLYRKEQETLLTSYSWIERNSGTVRIPIERAMHILAGRNLPVRKPVAVKASAAVPEQPVTVPAAPATPEQKQTETPS